MAPYDQFALSHWPESHVSGWSCPPPGGVLDDPPPEPPQPARTAHAASATAARMPLTHMLKLPPQHRRGVITMTLRLTATPTLCEESQFQPAAGRHRSSTDHLALVAQVLGAALRAEEQVVTGKLFAALASAD
jgi:hypothetical protein